MAIHRYISLAQSIRQDRHDRISDSVRRESERPVTQSKRDASRDKARRHGESQLVTRRRQVCYFVSFGISRLHVNNKVNYILYSPIWLSEKTEELVQSEPSANRVAFFVAARSSNAKSTATAILKGGMVGVNSEEAICMGKLAQDPPDSREILALRVVLGLKTIWKGELDHKE
ncbi:chloride channel F [Striga asiatica]|uniref:Chloride channel F n=1 Tax=Striga asiatica TaxID=4170 RepID=A0A5A7Q1P5_STRAF|nr:chloride channel F [Striga asiatica]